VEPLDIEIGRALRRARRARGLTLRELMTVSGGRFKPTSVAGYERGERRITLSRFCELSWLYGIPPDRLLGDVIRAVERRREPEIDVRLLEQLAPAEAALVSGFIRQIRALRRGPPSETIVIREGDLEVLATAAGKTRDELIELIEPVLRREGGSTEPTER
jgi:transcriptional regulator with XRE-family HTH domain